MIEFAQILEHLRIDSLSITVDEANAILMLEKAAIQACENFIDQKLFETTVPDDQYGIVINEQITVGCLLIITHFYENRSQVTPVQMSELPMGATWHWQPYKKVSI